MWHIIGLLYIWTAQLIEFIFVMSFWIVIIWAISFEVVQLVRDIRNPEEE